MAGTSMFNRFAAGFKAVTAKLQEIARTVSGQVVSAEQRAEMRRLQAEREYWRTHGFSGAKLARRAAAGTVGRAALK